MFDSHVIVDDNYSLLLTLALNVLVVLGLVFIVLSKTKSAKRMKKADEDDTHLRGLHDEEPDGDGSLFDVLRSRTTSDYVLFGLIAVVLVACCVSAGMKTDEIARNGIVTKSIDERIAVKNIEEKYNLSAVELVDDSDATNENQTKLMTDSPEFVGIYNGNTVVHFVVAFQENSGEPSIAVIPPSDGITATQIEKSTSRNAPDPDEDDQSKSTDQNVIEALSR